MVAKAMIIQSVFYFMAFLIGIMNNNVKTTIRDEVAEDVSVVIGDVDAVEPMLRILLKTIRF